MNKNSLSVFLYNNFREYISNMIYYLYSVLIVCLTVSTAFSQASQKVLHGLIQDGSGEAVPFAHVYILRSISGCYSSEDGVFKLAFEEEGHSTLVISAVGYEKKSIYLNLKILSEEPLRINLKEEFRKLEPLVITSGGYNLHEISSKSSMNRQQLKDSPNLISDVFRSVKVLPSLSNTDYSVRPIVRGGNFYETGVYLDGLELINPYHLDISGGVEGIFNSDYISNVQLFPGAFSSRFTDKTSAILLLESPGYVEKSELSISLDLLHASLDLKLKVSDKLSIQSNVRRGYWDVLLNLESLGTNVLFYDTYHKIKYRINDDNLIEMNALFGWDEFSYDQSDAIDKSEEFYESKWKKSYLWMAWKSFVGADFYRKTVAGHQKLNKRSYFRFEDTIETPGADISAVDIFSITDNSTWDISKKAQLQFGGEFRHFHNKSTYDELRYDIHASTSSNLVENEVEANVLLDGQLYALYTEGSILFNDKISFLAGVRFSGQSFTNGLQIAPRANLRFNHTDALTSNFGYGIFFQPDNYFDLKTELGQENLATTAEKASHFTYDFTYSKTVFKLQVNTYYKRYHKLRDDTRYTQTERIAGFKTWEKNTEINNGQAYGLEILGNYTYGLGSTLTFSYAFHHASIQDQDGNSFTRITNIPQEFNIVNIWKFRKGVTLSATWQLRSGKPYTPIVQLDAFFKPNGDQVVFYDLGEKNSDRYESYSSFDLKINKAWETKKMSWNIYLNVLNMFNSKNIRNFYHTAWIRESGPVAFNTKQTNYFPLFVSPGVVAKFK